jgi:hypothetical protein
LDIAASKSPVEFTKASTGPGAFFVCVRTQD